MSVIFYSKTCEGCRGNQALTKMKQVCKEKGIDFEERRTILWKVYEKEANEISDALSVTLPFFYNTETKQAMEGNTFTPIEEIKKFAKIDN